jgi:hypothetical protein
LGRRPWLAISLLIAVSTLVRALVALSLRQPRIYGDELYYWHAARSIVREFAIRFMNVGWDFPSVLYPLLLTPAVQGNDLFLSYDIARCINALLVSLVACPVYLVARRFLAAAPCRSRCPSSCPASATGQRWPRTCSSSSSRRRFTSCCSPSTVRGTIPATVFLVLTYFTAACGAFAGFGPAVLVLGIKRHSAQAGDGSTASCGCSAEGDLGGCAGGDALRILPRPELDAGLKAILMGGATRTSPGFSSAHAADAGASGLFATLGLWRGSLRRGGFAIFSSPTAGAPSARRSFAILLVCCVAMFLAMATQNVLMNDIQHGLPPRFHERYLFCLVLLTTWRS